MKEDFQKQIDELALQLQTATSRKDHLELTQLLEQMETLRLKMRTKENI